MYLHRFTAFFAAAAIACTVSYGNPLSGTGIGIVIQEDAGVSKGMGGAGVANEWGTSIIRSNPALLSTHESGRYVMGTSSRRNGLEMQDGTSSVLTRTRVDIYQIIIPLKGFRLGWGFSPYSRAEGNFVFEGNSPVVSDSVTFSGGINVTSLALGYSFRDVVRVGVGINFNFGTISERWLTSFDDATPLTTTVIERRHSGASPVFGLTGRVGRTTLGFGYTGQADLERRVMARLPGTTGDEELFADEISLPVTWRLGVSSNLSRRVNTAADFSYSQWEKASRSDTEKERYVDSWNFGAGVRYVPDQDGIGVKYLRKIPVSAGLRLGTLYHRSLPNLNKVEEKALTLGFELPLKDNLGSIVTTFDAGIRGDRDKNGWSENFLNVGLMFIGSMK